MLIRKYRLLIVIAFLGIFSAKMMISMAPVFVLNIDKDMMKSVIMQLELEHESDGDCSKTVLKYLDCKLNIHFNPLYSPILYHINIKNCFIDHIKRYVDPYHPSVPTPPPNLS
jgi:hypothetical protein